MTNSTNVAAPKVVRPKALVGTWALRSLRQYRADGKTAEPMGSDPHGYITYLASGHVHCILGPSARGKLGLEPDQFGAREGLSRALFALPRIPALLQLGVASLKTVCYAGTWEVLGDKVIHHAEIAGLPDWEQTDIVRGYEVDGSTLRLTAQFPDNRIVVEWVRV